MCKIFIFEKSVTKNCGVLKGEQYRKAWSCIISHSKMLIIYSASKN